MNLSSREILAKPIAQEDNQTEAAQKGTKGRETVSCLSGVIQRLEKDWALIKLDDGQIIRWPVDKLAARIQVGEEVKLVITNKEDIEEPNMNKLAKALLNEILSSRE